MSDSKIIQPFAQPVVKAMPDVTMMRLGGTPLRVLDEPSAVLVIAPKKHPVSGQYMVDVVEFLLQQLAQERAATHAIAREVAHLRAVVAQVVEESDAEIDTVPPWGDWIDSSPEPKDDLHATPERAGRIGVIGGFRRRRERRR